MKTRTPKPRVGEDGHWAISVAKGRLSDIVRRAHERGPQVLTSHGRQVAVVEAVRPVIAAQGVNEETLAYSAPPGTKEKTPTRPARFWSERSRGIGDDLILPERVKVTHRDIDLE